MASITDLIKQQVSSVAGGVNLPQDTKETVLNGLSSSILGSLTQTVMQTGGVDTIKELLTGKTNVAASPVTGLATNLFKTDVLQNLNLTGTMKNQLTSLVPKAMGLLGNIIKDQDGDGDVDLNDIILTLKGGSGGSSILGAATSILGGLFGSKGGGSR